MPYIFALTDTPSYQTVISTVSSTLSETNLASVLTYGLGLSVVLVLFWWSCRKVLSMLVRSFMRGKLRL